MIYVRTVVNNDMKEVYKIKRGMFGKMPYKIMITKNSDQK